MLSSTTLFWSTYSRETPIEAGARIKKASQAILNACRIAGRKRISKFEQKQTMLYRRRVWAPCRKPIGQKVHNVRSTISVILASLFKRNGRWSGEFFLLFLKWTGWHHRKWTERRGKMKRTKLLVQLKRSASSLEDVRWVVSFVRCGGVVILN